MVKFKLGKGRLTKREWAEMERKMRYIARVHAWLKAKWAKEDARRARSKKRPAQRDPLAGMEREIEQWGRPARRRTKLAPRRS